MKRTQPQILQGKDTRTRIIRQAISLFSQKGYHATSVEDIAKAAGITKGAFYWHFESKEGLLESFLEEWERRFLHGLIHAIEEEKGTALEKFKKLSHYTSVFAIKNRELCVSFDALSGELVGSGKKIEKHFKRIYGAYRNLLFGLIEEGKKEKVVRQDLDSQLTALIIMSFHHGLLLQWSMNRSELDGVAFMSTYRAILSNGIFLSK
jgi:AcrR family transcriptional regulator